MVNPVDPTLSGASPSNPTEGVTNARASADFRGRKFFVHYTPSERVAVAAAVASAVFVGLVIAGAAAAMPALLIVGVVGACVSLTVALAACMPSYDGPHHPIWIRRRPHFEAPPPPFPPPHVFHRRPRPVYCAPPPPPPVFHGPPPPMPRHPHPAACHGRPRHRHPRGLW